MTSLRPPSTSPSPTPPVPNNARNTNSRSSMGPTNNRLASIQGGLGGNNPSLNPVSPRPGNTFGGNRPTSEVLASAGLGGSFQTPESEAIDQWFENLQNYEIILEDMAKASMDANFKDELSAIEQWFRVLSEAERTAALYSLLQHSTQMQIRFFVTVLQQMARSDPMTALLSPGVGGSMQAQMEAKLNSMGLKSPGVQTPGSARNFAPQQRQSLIIENQSSNFLSPESALGGNSAVGSEAAQTLAQQRARLKANASHRISAPGTLSAALDGATGGRSVWQSGASNLGQVDEGSATPEEGRSSPITQMANLNSARPKSTDFAGALRNMRSNSGDDAGTRDSSVLDMLSPMVGGNWASQVNTPLNPMFANTNNSSQLDQPGQTLDAVTSRIASWNISNSSGGKVTLEDPKKFRRASKSNSVGPSPSTGLSSGGDIYDENGNYMSSNSSQPGGHSNPRSRNVSGSGNTGGNRWESRSPGMFSNSSSRYGDDSGLASPIGMSGFNGLGGLGGTGLGMGAGGMGGMNMNNMSMLMNQMSQLNAAGMGGMNGMMDPNMQAQLLAAQIAAANGGMLNPAFLMQNSGGMGPGGQGGMRNMRGGGGGRSPSGARSNAGSNAGTGNKDSSNKEKQEEDVDPKLLEDIPAWFRSLRLHKYTPNFQGMHWRDIVVMDESTLEGKGVAVVGARRKMLKTFELVRAKMGIEMPNPPSIPA